MLSKVSSFAILVLFVALAAADAQQLQVGSWLKANGKCLQDQKRGRNPQNGKIRGKLVMGNCQNENANDERKLVKFAKQLWNFDDFSRQIKAMDFDDVAVIDPDRCIQQKKGQGVRVNRCNAEKEVMPRKGTTWAMEEISDGLYQIKTSDDKCLDASEKDPRLSVCDSENSDQQWEVIETPGPCTKEYRPVCVDGEEFSNKCVAKNYFLPDILKNDDIDTCEDKCSSDVDCCNPSDSCITPRGGSVKMCIGRADKVGLLKSDDSCNPCDAQPCKGNESNKPICKPAPKNCKMPPCPQHTCEYNCETKELWTADKTKFCNKVVCPTIYEPVCVDGVNYDNECLARKENPIGDIKKKACPCPAFTCTPPKPGCKYKGLVDENGCLNPCATETCVTCPTFACLAPGKDCIYRDSEELDENNCPTSCSVCPCNPDCQGGR